MTRWTHTLSATLMALGLALGANTVVAEPVVSVPSTPGSNGRVVIKGSAVAPLSNVTVRFANAQAAPIDMVAQASDKGRFTVSFRPPLTGSYSVSVFDSAGQLIGQGNFGVIR